MHVGLWFGNIDFMGILHCSPLSTVQEEHIDFNAPSQDMPGCLSSFNCSTGRCNHNMIVLVAMRLRMALTHNVGNGDNDDDDDDDDDAHHDSRSVCHNQGRSNTLKIICTIFVNVQWIHGFYLSSGDKVHSTMVFNTLHWADIETCFIDMFFSRWCPERASTRLPRKRAFVAMRSWVWVCISGCSGLGKLSCYRPSCFPARDVHFQFFTRLERWWFHQWGNGHSTRDENAGEMMGWSSGTSSWSGQPMQCQHSNRCLLHVTGYPGTLGSYYHPFWALL